MTALIGIIMGSTSDWETMQVRRGINDFLSGVEKPKYSPGVQTGFDVTDEDLDDMDPGEAGRLRDMAAKEQARGLPERKSWFGSLVTVPV